MTDGKTTCQKDRLGNATCLPITRMLEYPPAQQIFIEMKDKLKRKTNYTLMLRFKSRLSRELEGFYLSSYTTQDGEKK